MTYVIAVRTKFFDDCLLEAAGRGVHQIVLPGAGLDARAFRLSWPNTVTVYEIDQPEILAFKNATLKQVGASAQCERITIAADLRSDWLEPLLAAGFDPSLPTIWVAEGLFPYLSAATQESFCITINSLPARDMSLCFDVNNPRMRKIFVTDGRQQSSAGQLRRQHPRTAP